MIDLPIDSSREQALVRALKSSHRIRLDVTILDRDEKPVGGLSAPEPMVLSGSVDVTATEDVTRTLDLTLLDPGHKLAFVPDHPAQGGLYMDNYVAVEYEVEVDELEDWISIPVFWGPLSSFEHNGAEVTITADSKEALGLEPHRVVQGYTLHRGERVDEAMRRVLRKIGERRFHIPRLNHKLHNDRPVRPDEEPWRVIVGGSDLEGKQPALIDMTGERAHHAFYDARGRFRVRRAKQQQIFTFARHKLLSKPTLAYDTTEAINYVKVSGGQAKGSKQAAKGHAELPPSDPMSPARLGRHGTKRYRVFEKDSENLKSDADCNRRARDLLDHQSKAALSVEFECLPMPFLEQFDKVAVETEEGRIDFILKNFTIPLVSTDAMSVSFTKNIAQHRVNRRRGNKGRGGKGRR